MKQMKAWMLAAILICGTAAMFTSCKANEDSPVIVVNCPTITIQPENVMYTLGDAEYPKLNVVAIASAGELTYEWFVKNEEGNYYSSGITTAELDLHAFIDNMIEMLREEAVGDYTFMCKVTDGNGTVESNEATLTIAANPESGLAEKIIGKWMVAELDGKACPTNLKAVVTFLSSTKASGSLSDFYSTSWNDQVEADVKIDGNKMTITAKENEHTTHVLNVTVSSITDEDMVLSSEWTVLLDGQEVHQEVYEHERWVRVTEDYADAIVGTWEGQVTRDLGDDTNGVLHRWECKADGTYAFYDNVDGEWVEVPNFLADYFVDGTLLCSRWQDTENSEELREWWEIESIKDGVMKGTALRMREDGTTYTATFQMTKVKD